MAYISGHMAKRLSILYKPGTKLVLAAQIKEVIINIQINSLTFNEYIGVCGVKIKA